MKIRKASDVLKEQMYSDTRIAIVIADAANEKKCKAYINIELVEPEQIKMLKDNGYSLYNSGGRLEISWEYAQDGD